MKVLSISSDRMLFSAGSPVADRMVGYARNVDELHIIVFSTTHARLESASLGKNVWIYPTSSLNKFWYVFDAYRIGLRVAKERLFKKGRSLITTQDPFETGLVGMLLKKKLNIPLQVQLHTDVGSPYFKTGFNRIRISIARFVFKKADTVRAVSNNIAEEIAQSFHVPPSKISVLPVMVDKEKILHSPITTDLKSKYPQFNPLILMVGRLEPEKNYSFAFSVFSEICKKSLSAGLVIVGNGSEEERLETYARELGIEKNVSFERNNSNISSYYKTADIFLHTSVFEGYGLVFAEAALSGCPIVSSKVGIAKGFEKTEALICEVNDASCFIAAISELVVHREKRQEISSNAQKKINEQIPSKEEFLQQHQKLWENTASL